MLRDPGQAGKSVRIALTITATMTATMAALVIDAPRAAAADAPDDRHSSGEARLAPSERSAPLMEGIAAEAPSGRGTGTFLGGYDGAHETALFRSQVEVRLISTVSILG